MKPAILLAAYGSTLPAAQDSVESLRRRVKNLWPALECRVACTSRQILDRNDGPGEGWLSVEQALNQLARDGYSRVAVQSLHVIPGSEYQEVLRAARNRRKAGALERISVGKPLLFSRADVESVAEALARSLPPLENGRGVVAVAHGSSHPGRARLDELLARLEQLGARVFTATLESENWDSLPARVAARGLSKVWLLPLLLGPGRHLQRDILGHGPDSLVSRLAENSVDSEVLEQGMAASDDVAAVWISHLDAALGEMIPEEMDGK
jgi:sirohydrochlorin cobaltochelatase